MHAVEAEVIVLLPTLVSNALAERLHTRSARNESNGSWQLAVGSWQLAVGSWVSRQSAVR
jgi:hypothetical protein